MGVDVTHQNGGERGESIDDLAKAHHEHRVHRQIEHFLGGKVLQASATPAAEHVLFDQALQHRIVYTTGAFSGAAILHIRHARSPGAICYGTRY
jgi:hypothetical protein